ncbi:hypothetical protein KRM28CT15_08840 [Krasilnikovia sp. M28-CT-15]
MVGTPASLAWLDDGLIKALEIRTAFRDPAAGRRAPTPDAMVVRPATFNTVNKVALGLADNYALGLLCEAVGSGVPTVVVPMVNQKLWSHRHPAHSCGPHQRVAASASPMAPSLAPPSSITGTCWPPRAWSPSRG